MIIKNVHQLKYYDGQLIINMVNLLILKKRMKNIIIYILMITKKKKIEILLMKVNKLKLLKY